MGYDCSLTIKEDVQKYNDYLHFTFYDFTTFRITQPCCFRQRHDRFH